MRKRKILLIAAAIVFICLVFILFIPSLFKKQVSDILKQELNDNLVGDISFSDSDINLWRHFPQFTVTLEDFALAGKKEFKGDTLVHTKELHLVFGTWQLLFENEIEIRELDLYDPAFHVVILKNGKANYDVVATDSTAQGDDSGVSVNIEACTIKNGKFRYYDKGLGIQSRGEDVNLSGTADMINDIFDLDVEGEISKFTVDMEGKNYVRNKNISIDLNAAFNLKDQSITFSESWLNVNHLAMAITGKYAYLGDDHYFDLAFHSGDTDFKDLLSLNDRYFRDNFNGVKIKGHLALLGNVKGYYRPAKNISPSFKVDFKINDGYIKYDELSSSVNNIFFDLVAENADSIIDHTVLDFKDFSLRLGENPIKGSLRLKGLLNSEVKSEIIADVNLQDLTKIYPMEGITLDGKLKLDLKADGVYNGFLSELKEDLEHRRIPAFDISLNIKNGTLKYNNLPEAINNINFHLNAKNKSGYFDSTSLRIEKLEATLGDNPLKGFIHINGFKNPIIESDIKASLDLSEVKNFYPSDGLTLKGLFNIDMSVAGELNEQLKKFPKVDARVNLTNAYLKSATYPFPMENTHLILEAINSTGNINDTKINIDTLTYSIENESFLIEGTITDLQRYNYDIAAKGIIYLEKLSKIFDLDKAMELAGEIDIDLKTSGNYVDLMSKAYHKLPTAGKMLFSNISFKNDQVPDGIKVKQGDLIFTNEKMFLDTLHGTLGNSPFNVTGHFYNYLAWFLHSEEKIKGDLLFESDSINFNQLLHESHVGYTDTIHHDLLAFKIPENIDFRMDARIDKMRYKDIDIEGFNGELIVKDGVLTLNETDFTTLDGDFSLSGDYDTRDMDHPLFDFDLKIEELDINKAHGAFVTIQALAPAAGDTYGIFSVDYALKGELHHNLYPVLETLEGGGTVRIREAKINGMKIFNHISGITKKEELKNPDLKDVVMETVVDHGIIYIKPFSMKLGGFETDIEGKHDINGSMNYVLKMALPPFDIVKIPLHVNGTYDKPKVHLGKGHEEMLKKITETSNH
jgi:AsmA protein